MPGPAPKPAGERRRRNPPMANTVKLPAGGRSGPTPPWPGGYEPNEAEWAHWARLWCLPQAVVWERLGWADPVARYVRLLVAVDATLASPKPIVALVDQLNRLEDRLGLTPMSVLRLRWEVEGSEAPPAVPLRPVPTSRRRRLRAVDDAPPAR